MILFCCNMYFLLTFKYKGLISIWYKLNMLYAIDNVEKNEYFIFYTFVLNSYLLQILKISGSKISKIQWKLKMYFSLIIKYKSLLLLFCMNRSFFYWRKSEQRIWNTVKLGYNEQFFSHKWSFYYINRVDLQNLQKCKQSTVKMNKFGRFRAVRYNRVWLYNFSY